MWDYSDKVMDHYEHPRNVGEVEGADAVGEVGSIACGDALKLTLKIDKAASSRTRSSRPSAAAAPSPPPPP